MKKHERTTKQTFKQIFRDHFNGFAERYARYEKVRDVVEKMLGCSDPEKGYAEYFCPRCHEHMVVPFSCKSKFCLSCAMAHLSEWVNQIEKSLFEGVDYRHLI
jgi:hypothetical protein